MELKALNRANRAFVQGEAQIRKNIRLVLQSSMNACLLVSNEQDGQDKTNQYNQLSGFSVIDL